MEPLAPLPNFKIISPLVARLLAGNPGPFTMQGTNIYLIGCNDSRIMIDVGEGLDCFKDTFNTFIKQNNIKHISHIILTHSHHDHVAGLQSLLSDPNLANIFHNTIVYKIPTDTKHINNLTEAQKYAESVSIPPPELVKAQNVTLQILPSPGHTKDHLCLYLHEENAFFSGDSVLGQNYSPVFENLRIFINSLTSNLNFLADKRSAVLYPSHTKDHLCLYLHEENAFFSGDSVLGQNYSPVFENLRIFINSLTSNLKFLNDKRSAVLYPSHGPVVENAYEAISKLIEHRNKRDCQIIECLRKAGGLAVLEIVDIIYKDYPSL
ncbi:Beta-lactamase-like domain-containing protein [Rozella allomycis CSF55]|uniref:Beta-lactamase-like domain-containing protein n=1 Tax=Rozella allomycis (strain CSF55) TaxID=988480 RepID=A0A075B3U0_ROZAC|nr:Beta-lactamase-like domain-containing protein [Rozella allomycis CSF55]|eukprot:EPZ35762.1 Beta-lactamase-like domain-containing protein [Rozella allomycis CSF55]